MKKLCFLLLTILLYSCIEQETINYLEQYPHAFISNGIIDASVFLPDAEKGFYRSARFEWSGMIYDLTYEGHSYFLAKRDEFPLPLSQDHDPLKPDNAASLADQFQNGPERIEGADTYMVIGIGNLDAETNEIVDTGKWTTEPRQEWIEFTHMLSDSFGYGYTYKKRMVLTTDKSELVIEYSLENTGTRNIECEQYNHNFFTIDSDYIGKYYELQLFFEPEFTTFHPDQFKEKESFYPYALIKDKKIIFLQPFINVEGGIFSVMGGYDKSVAHNHAVIRNIRTHACVDISGDFPLERFHFWANRTTICPEFFIKIDIKPGETRKWTRTYKFFIES